MISQLIITLLLVVSTDAISKAIGKQVVPPTNGKLSVNFKFTAQGTSSAGLLAYNITNNVGTMIIRGETYNTVAYYTQVMGYPPVVRWFDLIGVNKEGTNLAVAYIGCNPPPDTNYVTIVWEEDFFNSIEPDNPGNTDNCEFTDLSGQPNFIFDVQFPSLSGLPTSPLPTGIIIKGSQVFLNNNTGWLMIEGNKYSIIPISTVDCDGCGQNCDECPKSPWYEIHFIYYSPLLEQTGFGIFYIYPNNATFVQLNYTLTLPTLDTPAINYNASWTGDVSNNFAFKALDGFTPSEMQKSLGLNKIWSPNKSLFKPKKNFSKPLNRN